jgi:hypothetical protein
MDHLNVDADQAYNTSLAVGNDAEELREELAGLQRDCDLQALGDHLRLSKDTAATPRLTYNPSELPDISSYLDLIDRFIGRGIAAPDFEKSFLQAMKSERRILGDPVSPGVVRRCRCLRRPSGA